MRSFFTALILVGSSLALAGCDNGKENSTSGGGSNLNLSGTWLVSPNVRTKNGHHTQNFFVTLQQTGKNVVSLAFTYDPEQSNNSCDKHMTHVLTGTASGNTFTGSIRGIGEVASVEPEPEPEPEPEQQIESAQSSGPVNSLATFTVTGTSNSLAGSYRITYDAGACLGARTGTVTMRRN